MAGLRNRQLTQVYCSWEFCLRYDFGSSLKALSRAHQGLVLKQHMAFFIWGYTLVWWLSGFWAQTSTVPSRKRATVDRYIDEATVPGCGGGEECGPCPVFALYPGIHLKTEEKSRKNLSQVFERCLAKEYWARLVKEVASTGLLTPVALALRVQRLGSTLDQRRYLPHCWNKGFSTSTIFGSKLQLGFWCGRRRMELPNPCEFAYYWRTYQGALVARRRQLDS